jgi:hypothetical protein
MRLGDIDSARELAAKAIEALHAVGRNRPEQGHASAMALGGAALIEVEAGALVSAHRFLTEAYPVALATRDMPIVAMIGVTLAWLEQRRGRAGESAEILGAAARLRGAEDPTHPEVARLTARLRERLGESAFTERFERGRALDRDGALARLDPRRLDAAAVGAERQGDEHHEQDPHPDERPQHV